MIIAVDQSLRSTAAVSLSNDGELKRFCLISPDKSIDGEELLAYQWEHLIQLIQAAEYCSGFDRLQGIVFEGLSFGAVGQKKDLLAGLFWYLRTRYYLSRGDVPGIVPVSAWRSKVLSKEEQREAKSRGKDGLKKACVDKLPAEVRQRFVDYIAEVKAKKDAIYDLCDAYWMGQYRLLLK